MATANAEREKKTWIKVQFVMETIIENTSVPADANAYRLKCIIFCQFLLFLDYDGEGEAMEDGMSFV